MPGRTWEDYLTLAVTEIREYGASSIQVMRRLRAMLEDLRESVRPEHRPAVDAEIARLDATVAAGLSLARWTRTAPRPATGKASAARRKAQPAHAQPAPDREPHAVTAGGHTVTGIFAEISVQEPVRGQLGEFAHRRRNSGAAVLVRRLPRLWGCLQRLPPGR